MTVGNASFEEVIHPIPGLVADGDLSTAATYQYHFVKISGDFKVALAGDDEMPIGILMNCPGDGQAAVVAGAGSVVKLKIGNTVTYGQKLGPKSDGSGEGEAVSASDDPAIALALAGGSDHDVIPVLIVGGCELAAS